MEKNIQKRYAGICNSLNVQSTHTHDKKSKQFTTI